MQTIILYKYLLAGAGEGAWVVASANAIVTWYDSNEGNKSKPVWFLEIDAGSVDLLISEANELQADMAANTATFYDAESACVCKLCFPSHQRCTEFSDEYHRKLFENLQAAGNAELGKPGDWFFKASEEVAMDWDVIEDTPEPTTPKAGMRQVEIVKKERVVHALAMGAGANSFMVQDNEISVLSNQYGAVKATDRGFMLTPPRGAASESFTPSRVMLMKNETQMNMLTAGERDKVYQVRIHAIALQIYSFHDKFAKYAISII